jgi:hypothetical protein
MGELTVDQQLRDIEHIANGGPDGMTAVNRFAKLDRRRMELEQQVKEIKKECDELQPAVLEWFTQQGIENIRTDECLVHVVQKWKVTPKSGYNKDDIVSALMHTGLEDMVTTSYHWTRMSSLARAAAIDGTELPAELLEVVDVGEEYKVQTRK